MRRVFKRAPLADSSAVFIVAKLSSQARVTLASAPKLPSKFYSKLQNDIAWTYGRVEGEYILLWMVFYSFSRDLRAKTVQRRSAQPFPVQSTCHPINGIAWEISQPQNWMRQRGFSVWGIQTGPFAALWAHFILNDFQLLQFHPGRPILITPEG